MDATHVPVGDVAHEHSVDGHVEHLHEHGRRQPRDDHHQRRRRDRVVHLQQSDSSQQAAVGSQEPAADSQ